MRRFSALVLMAMYFFFLTGGEAFPASEPKIGYVDPARAFDEYQKTKDFDKDLEKKGDTKQEEREKLVREIRKMRDEIELLNEAARAKKEEDIETKIRFLQEFDQDAKMGLTEERDDMVRGILREMDSVIREYGEAHGYSIILNDRVLLYGAKELDLTDEIIKILNDSYQK